jgi:hypothetical protein
MSSRTGELSVGRGCGDQTVANVNPRLESIVRGYIARFRANSDAELGSFRRERAVASAIERGGLATTPDGKRYHHQRRLPRALLKQAATELKRAKLERSRNFDELHERVFGAIGSVHGIGELTVYDTALRIGARLRYLPRRVYLHSGTRTGAKALGLDWRAPFVEVRELPRAFRVLEPHEIEDCLCIFKKRLKSAV